MGEIPMVPWESSSHRMKKYKMPRMPKYGMPHDHHHHHRYHRIKEPYLYEHLVKMVGHYVEVGTRCKTIKGKLKKVFPDHMMIEHDRRHYHIRLKSICFVAPMMDP